MAIAPSRKCEEELSLVLDVHLRECATLIAARNHVKDVNGRHEATADESLAALFIKLKDESALTEQQRAFAQAALEFGAKPSRGTSLRDLMPHIWIAADLCDLELLTLLLQFGADPSESREWFHLSGDTPLHIIFIKTHVPQQVVIAATRRLLLAGADPAKQNRDNFSSVCSAALKLSVQ